MGRLTKHCSRKIIYMETYLVIPLIPSLSDDRFERGELLVGHGKRAEDMLLEQRRARKRQQ